MSFPHSNTWTDPPSSSQRSIGWKTTATRNAIAVKPPRPIDNGWSSQLGSGCLPRSIPPRIGAAPTLSFNTPTLDSEDRAASQFREGEIVARFDSRLEGVESGIRANRKAVDTKFEQILNQFQKSTTVFKDDSKKLSKDLIREHQKCTVSIRDCLKKNTTEQEKSIRILVDGINRVNRTVTEQATANKKHGAEIVTLRQIVEHQREAIRNLGSVIRDVADILTTIHSQKWLTRNIVNVREDSEVHTPTTTRRDEVSVTVSESSEDVPVSLDLGTRSCEPKGLEEPLGYLSETDDDDDEDDSLFMQPILDDPTMSSKAGRPVTTVATGEDSLFTEAPKESDRLNHLYELPNVAGSNKRKFRAAEPVRRNPRLKLRRRWRKMDDDGVSQ